MSTGKRTLRKRKRQSPPSTSHIGRRLEKLRHGQRNLWGNDDDDDDNSNADQENRPSKIKATTDKTYILLTDSDADDDNASSRVPAKAHKSRKKSSRREDEHRLSDNDYKPTTRCPTCLICSILTTLTSYNCCASHLDALVHRRVAHQQQPRSKTSANEEQWPAQQVMILPMTDELLQRYLNSQDVYQLRAQSSSSITTQKKTSRKLTKKTTSTTSEVSEGEPTTVPKSRPAAPLTTEPALDSSLPHAGAIPPDATFTIVSSTSTTISSFDSPSVLDTCQLQQSSDQPIVIDDSQTENLAENATKSKTTNDPWTPITDETYAAIETVLEQNKTSQGQAEIPPAIARRTPAAVMASCLPKIQLKQGRYRQGKPIAEKSAPETPSTTTTNAASSTFTAAVITHPRPTSSLATIIEDESLVIQPLRSISEKVSQSNPTTSERQENTPEGLSDTVMSCLFAQDESSQHENTHLAGRSLSNEVLPLPPPSLPPVVTTSVEASSEENQTERMRDVSQSSQLTNDQSDTQPVISSTTTDKISTTPSRISYRRNPDGSLVSISRPRLSVNPSPSNGSRRKSTDVLSLTSQEK